jgi:2-deoxy-D-gluconate 3-dehydrogenase
VISFDFSGQVVVVTGGRRGIGQALALAYYRAGAHVAIIAKSEDDGGLDELFSSSEQRCRYYSVDIAIREARNALVQSIVDDFGSVDILINNAGFQFPASIFDYGLTQWDHDVELMLTAVFDLSVQAARHMKDSGGGKIVNIASISSFQGAKNIVGYSTAKHGLVGLTKCLANELAGHGINVNAVAPGIVDTDMAAPVFNNKARLSELASRVPAGRFATTDDIVPPVLFLTSEASKFIHGHVLIVDGGWMGR